MISRTIFICIQALLMQKISAQCIGAGYNGIVADGVAWGAAPWDLGLASPYPLIRETPCGERLVGLTLGTLAASGCRGFTVRSTSPLAPVGISVTSENVFDGAVVVQGTLPFLSTASLEGTLPSIGSGLISYGCGNGDVAILSEEVGPAGYGAGFGPIGPYELGPLGAYEYGAIGAPIGIAAGPGIGYGGCANIIY